MSKAIAGVITLLSLTLTMSSARADSPPNNGPSTISVSGNGSVDFVPDVARLTLGVRIESPTAQGATSVVNQRAAQVIAALRSAGIKDRSIKTASYNLEFRENPTPPPPPLPAGGAERVLQTSAAATSSNTEVVARMPSPGNYVASETLEVTTPVGLAGKALDVAIMAGANESFGLSYQASNAQALYRAALAKAVASAHESASVIANAAHVSIIGIQSISTNGSQMQPGPEPFMARSMAAAQVLPGTETAAATVFIVYKIR